MDVRTYNSIRKLKAEHNRTLNEFNKLAEKYSEDLNDELRMIAIRAIDGFYADYKPRMYERYGDLYNTYKIDVNVENYSVVYDVDFSPEYMKYHAENRDYIYEICFMEGWHGGAVSGEGHPDPGVPWWRLTFEQDKYSDGWYQEAKRYKKKPHDVIEKNMKKYIKKWDRLYGREIKNVCDDSLDKIRNIIDEWKEGLI